MAIEPRVMVGASQHAWVTALTQWVSEQGGAQLVGQALVPADLDGVDLDVLVVDGFSTLLNRRLVDELHSTGRVVLVLVNADRPEAEDGRLAELGPGVAFQPRRLDRQGPDRARNVDLVRPAHPGRPHRRRLDRTGHGPHVRHRRPRLDRDHHLGHRRRRLRRVRP
ncbi:MAG: hypothetical protein ACFCVC_18225 [Acidimicrobiia bacterium]